MKYKYVVIDKVIESPEHFRLFEVMGQQRPITNSQVASQQAEKLQLFIFSASLRREREMALVDYASSDDDVPEIEEENREVEKEEATIPAPAPPSPPFVAQQR